MGFQRFSNQKMIFLAQVGNSDYFYNDSVYQFELKSKFRLMCEGECIYLSTRLKEH